MSAQNPWHHRPREHDRAHTQSYSPWKDFSVGEVRRRAFDLQRPELGFRQQHDARPFPGRLDKPRGATVGWRWRGYADGAGWATTGNPNHLDAPAPRFPLPDEGLGRVIKALAAFATPPPAALGFPQTGPRFGSDLVVQKNEASGRPNEDERRVVGLDVHLAIAHPRDVEVPAQRSTGGIAVGCDV